MRAAVCDRCADGERAIDRWEPSRLLWARHEPRSDPPATRPLDERSKALDLGHAHELTQAGEPVVASPLVVEVRIRPCYGLPDEPVLRQPLDRAVQRAGPELHGPPAYLLGLAHDGVAVLLSILQREEDVEGPRGERKEIGRVLRPALCHLGSPPFTLAISSLDIARVDISAPVVNAITRLQADRRGAQKG